jgi:diguanylate cyclase (GGDEF)-like protein
MSVHAPAIAALSAGAAGFLLGSVAAWPPVRRLRTEVARARHLAEHDPLTELPNRCGAQRHFRVQAAARRSCAAVLLDLDDFKAVNDSWGHHVGDAHLTAVADRLAAGCQPIGAFAARLAGDEFLLLLPPADPETVLRQVTAVLDRVGAPLVLPFDDTTAITSTPRASAGVALPEPDITWADLLRRADIALYQAKTQRGRAVLYTHDMYQPVSADAHPEPRLREQASDRMRRSRVRA